MHLTNYAINKTSDAFNDDEVAGTKRSVCWTTHRQTTHAGRQVPFFSYLSQHTPIFPTFLAISSYFLAILHATCISYISFWGFLFKISFF